MKRCNWSRGKKKKKNKVINFYNPPFFHKFFSNITTAVESLNVTFLLTITVFEFDNSGINFKVGFS